MFDAIRPFEQDCVREGHEPRNGMLLCAESHTTGDITPFSADVRIRAFDRVVQPYSKEELRSLLAFHVHAKPAFSQGACGVRGCRGGCCSRLMPGRPPPRSGG